jgi:hypothetical protein
MTDLAMLGVLLYALGVGAVMYHGIAFMTRKKVIAMVGGFPPLVGRVGRFPMGQIMGGAALTSSIMFLVLGLINR